MIVAALPAFNEEATIKSVISATSKYVDEVIVVDDGSTEKTAEIARLAGALVIRHDRNRGYGAALKSCFETARKIKAHAMVILDADGQHDPNEIPVVLTPILSGVADVVVGSRFIFKNQVKIPVYRKIGIQILNIAMLMFRLKVLDSQSGFRAYSNKAINIITPTEKGMAAGPEILLIAHKKGLKIIEVPINCSYDVKGSSQNPLFHGMSLLLSLLKLFFKNSY